MAQIQLKDDTGDASEKVGPVETFEVLTDEMKAKGRWWVMWTGWGAFELGLPWWIVGQHKNDPTLECYCAAVLANSEKEARAVIVGAHDEGEAGIVEWRGAFPRAVDWSPFNTEFKRGDWMQWPKEEER